MHGGKSPARPVIYSQYALAVLDDIAKLQSLIVKCGSFCGRFSFGIWLLSEGLHNPFTFVPAHIQIDKKHGVARQH